MMPSGCSSRHPGRALFASLALVANLIAAGVPVLHAWAHDSHAAADSAHPSHSGAEHGHAPLAPAAAHGDDDRHDAPHGAEHGHAPIAPADGGQDDHLRPPAHPPAAAGDGDHRHDASHPPALHEDCLLIHRVAPVLVCVLPNARPELLSLAADDAPADHPVSPVLSRAPPSADHARAPPLA